MCNLDGEPRAGLGTPQDPVPAKVGRVPPLEPGQASWSLQGRGRGSSRAASGRSWVAASPTLSPSPQSHGASTQVIPQGDPYLLQE